MTIADDAAGSGMGFDTITLAALDATDDLGLDALPFGVISMDAEGVVRRYNRVESQMAGLSREKVLGEIFFLTTGVCMNNYLVAQRFEDEAVLDVILDYVLTFRMRPTPVKLRLLKQGDSRFRYVLIQR